MKSTIPRSYDPPWNATLLYAATAGVDCRAVVCRRNPPPRRAVVDIATVCPGIVVELRYASAGNITGAPVYPKGARALIRRETAQRLRHAQQILTEQGYSLKIRDAYRPSFAHEALWFARPHHEFLADPARGGSLHERGVAVDVTLVALKTREDVAMPTDFDHFGQAAARAYRGKNPIVAANLTALQRAMAAAGFLAMRDEWWHFVDKDFRRYGREIRRRCCRQPKANRSTFHPLFPGD